MDQDWRPICPVENADTSETIMQRKIPAAMGERRWEILNRLLAIINIISDWQNKHWTTMEQWNLFLIMYTRHSQLETILGWHWKRPAAIQYRPTSTTVKDLQNCTSWTKSVWRKTIQMPTQNGIRLFLWNNSKLLKWTCAKPKHFPKGAMCKLGCRTRLNLILTWRPISKEVP